MILVTAAGGKTGRHIIPRLAAKGEAVRALIHAKQSADLKELGAKELVIGDMMDPATLRKATAGVRAVVHVGPGFNPKETDMGIAAIDAAAEAKVERFVYISIRT